MNNEFDWWLLIVGLVGGAGLVWLMLSTGRDAPDDPDGEERQAEAAWIASRLSDDGTPLDEATTGRVLALHRDWETGGGEVDWEWDRSSDAATERRVAVEDGTSDGVVEAPSAVSGPQERFEPPA